MAVFSFVLPLKLKNCCRSSADILRGRPPKPAQS